MIRFSLELDVQKINGKRYVRVAPVMEASSFAKAGVASVIVILLFVGSIYAKNRMETSAKEQLSPVAQETVPGVR